MMTLLDNKILRSKIRKFFFLFFALQITGTVYAQNYLPYYHLVNEARWQSFKKNYNKADSIYQAAFSLVDNVQPEHLFEAAKNVSALGNMELCYGYLFEKFIKRNALAKN